VLEINAGKAFTGAQKAISSCQDTVFVWEFLVLFGRQSWQKMAAYSGWKCDYLAGVYIMVLVTAQSCDSCPARII
jgi:hypothetical protein